MTHTCKLTKIFWKDLKKNEGIVLPFSHKKQTVGKRYTMITFDEVDSYNYWVELFTTIQEVLCENKNPVATN